MWQVAPFVFPILTVIHRVARDVVSSDGATPLPITEHDTSSRFKVKFFINSYLVLRMYFHLFFSRSLYIVLFVRFLLIETGSTIPCPAIPTMYS